MKLNVQRSKVSYTVMIVSNSASRRQKQFQLKAGLIVVFVLLILGLFAAAVGYGLYNSAAASKAMKHSQEQEEEIARIEEENKKAAEENEELKKELAALKEELVQQEEEQQAMVAEEEKAHMPTGFPLSGVAQIKAANGEGEDETGMRADGERLEVIFTAAAGSNVVASAPGTVASVSQDAETGNLISVDHGNGYVSMYRNTGEPMVREGSEVATGSVLFVIAEDNLDTGYSIRKDDSYVDPMEMIEGNG